MEEKYWLASRLFCLSALLAIKYGRKQRESLRVRFSVTRISYLLGTVVSFLCWRIVRSVQYCKYYYTHVVFIYLPFLGIVIAMSLRVTPITFGERVNTNRTDSRISISCRSAPDNRNKVKGKDVSGDVIKRLLGHIRRPGRLEGDVLYT